MNKDLRDKIEDLHKNDHNDSGNPEDYSDQFKSSEEKDNMSAKQEIDQFEKAEAKPQETKKKPQDDMAHKYAELEDQYKRLMADYKNMSKRMNKEREEIHKYAAQVTIEKILPAMDNFDFAAKSINENTDAAEAKKSIEMLKTQLVMSLAACGLETINTNSKFDPQFHEAISKVKDESKEEGTIVEVVKEGYKIGDRVIRAAMVVVSTKEN